MEIFNLKDKPEYLGEVSYLEYEEWADNKDIDREERLSSKRAKLKSLLSNDSFCKLVLVDDYKLIGFISIFPSDGDERKELTPWYATMYVKKEYRGKGYSKILNDAILKEAKARGFKEIYLKTDLVNYYDKFGAIYLDKLSTGESLYKFDL